MNQPLKVHGGKHYLAARLIALMPPHLHYVEAYFGGGSVLLAKTPNGVSEVANDVSGELINFWRHLADDNCFSHLQRRLEATPFAQVEFVDAFRNRERPERWTPLDRAVQFFILARQSRQGLGNCFATLSRNRTRAGMNEQVSSWLTAIDGLPEIHARLKRVVILCEDALKVIRSQDGPNTFFYLDPPYMHATRSTTTEYGAQEMSDDQHCDLLLCLTTIEGRFMLSGYRSRMYDRIATEERWRRADFVIDCKASSAKDKPTRTESVWMNY